MASLQLVGPVVPAATQHSPPSTGTLILWTWGRSGVGLSYPSVKHAGVSEKVQIYVRACTRSREHKTPDVPTADASRTMWEFGNAQNSICP